MPDRLAEFGNCLLDPERPAPQGVVGPDGKPSARRFAVYRNNVIVSLVEALQAAYPVVARLVGEEFFRAMARIYAAQSPPRTPIMLDYGDGFAEFIEGFPPTRGLPYLPDMARLERAWLEAYHAADAPSPTPKALAAIPANRIEDVVLDLHPSMRLVNSSYPIVTIWRANRPDGQTGRIELGQSETALVLRLDADVEVCELHHPGAAGFLADLRHGRTVGEAAVAAMRDNPKFDLTGNLTGLISLGAIIGWRLDDPLNKESIHVPADH